MRSIRPTGRRFCVMMTAFAGLLIGPPVAWSQTEASIPGDPIAGRKIFAERDCVRCHSIWGNGGTLGPDLATVGAGRSLQQLGGMFWNHTPRMIETVRARGFDWPSFTEDEMANIISYVYYVKLFDEPGDPELGSRWFGEKRCYECHAVGGNGGNAGPPLDEYARFTAPIMLAQGMWNHSADMQAEQARQQVAIPTFIGREIADLQAYIRQNSSLANREIVLHRPPDPNAGRRLFRSKGCARCHADDGRGTAVAPDLRTVTKRLSVSEMAGQLWNHSARMRRFIWSQGIPFPRFEGTEMADVIAFMYYLRFYDTEGDVQTGETLFNRKGCSNCHSRGSGTPTGPDLSKSEAVLTPLGLATAMWDHAPAMYDGAQVPQINWPRFEGDEMRDIAAYLRSLASPVQ